MAMEIKAIPTLKGKEAEHFVKAADKAYKNQNKHARITFMRLLKFYDFYEEVISC